MTEHAAPAGGTTPDLTTPPAPGSGAERMIQARRGAHGATHRG
jgi:hypothetical protein